MNNIGKTIVQKLKGLGLDAAMVVLFLVISFAYFHLPVTQGLVLTGHDSDAAVGQGREQTEYRKAHDGETTRWTNSMFSGMPTYQISPSYGATDKLTGISRVYNLWTTGALCYVFVMLLGFYIMMRAFDFKQWMAALGAIVWAFSSYFFIIIAAGHIWKVMTLAYIPPTIGGLILCYRGRYLWGGFVTALFTAFQVLSNHVQMTYYFLFVMGLIVLCCGVEAMRRGKKCKMQTDDNVDGAGSLSLSDRLFRGLTPSRWLKATGMVIVAGLLGVMANLPNLYHTYDYAKYTMRGGSELSAQKGGDKAEEGFQLEAGQGGLDYDYITQWSYGIDETMTFLIPDYKGGGTGSAVTEENYNDEDVARLIPYLQYTQQAAQAHPDVITALPGMNAYWGDQPFTVGPVYVGALFVFLFILGLFVVRGPLKWALAGATVVSLLFAWGHNSPALTHFFIDHLPMYNKFRTVSSALVIAEFTIPLLGMLALAEVLRKRDLLQGKRGVIGVSTAGVLTIGVCLALYLFPGLAGNCLSNNEADTIELLTRSGAFTPDQAAEYTGIIASLRHGVLAASAGRSLLFLLIGTGILLAAVKVKRLPSWSVCAALGLVMLVDMWPVNRTYLNDENFRDPEVRMQNFDTPSPTDELILRDTTYYRVVDLSVNTFNDNSVSYWHHNIGGYHAAKLQRYQDLIDRCLHAELARIPQETVRESGKELAVMTDSAATPVLNMLNMKYCVLGTQSGSVVALNPYANGNGWFVKDLHFVKGADAEMGGLQSLDTKHEAVADESFRPQLDGSSLGEGTVEFLSYQPNELRYAVSSDKGGVVAFSEIYYPGWTVTIDGQSAEPGRVNYVLRALKVPAGKHEVVFTFRPESVSTTNTLAVIAIVIIFLFFAGAFALFFMKQRRVGKDSSPQSAGE